MTRWLILSLIVAQLMGCDHAPASYEETQRGICKAKGGALVETYSEFSKASGFQCL